MPLRLQADSRSSHVKRFGGFFGLQLLGLLAPFLALPIIARVGAGTGWVDFGVGQAVGAVAATAVMLGWATAGPARLSVCASPQERGGLLRESAIGRVVLAAAVAPLAGLVAGLVAGSSTFSFTAAAVSSSSSLMGLSNGWFAVGLGRPWLLGKYDLLPKLLASVTGVVLVLLSGEVIMFAIPAAVFPLASFFLMLRKFGNPTDAVTFGRIRESFISQAPILATNVVGALYAAAPVVVAAGLLSTRQASEVVSADKLFRMSLFTVVALGNSLQSWVLSDSTRIAVRLSRAVKLHLGLGIVGGVVLAVSGPIVSSIAFGAGSAASYSVSIAYGIAFFCTCLSTPFIRNALVVVGLNWVPLTATIAAASAGFLTMAFVAGAAGANGIAWAYAVSEVLAMILMIAIWFRLRSRFPNYLPHPKGLVS